MNKEESIEILSSYKSADNRAQSMLNKIHEIETTIYSAQAGFVEQEAGVRVSGGSHTSRTQKIAELVDLKDKYIIMYSKNSCVCFNTLTLILAIYSNREETREVSANESLKLQKYENVLIYFYINKMKVEEIANKAGYSSRQAKRLLNAARNAFYERYKDENYLEVKQKLQQRVAAI